MKSSEIKIVDDLFDSQTVCELIDSVDKHFEQNLMSSDFIEVTNSIIDCHDSLCLIQHSSLTREMLEYILSKGKAEC